MQEWGAGAGPRGRDGRPTRAPAPRGANTSTRCGTLRSARCLCRLTTNAPISAVRKRGGRRGVKRLLQSHTASKRQSRDPSLDATLFTSTQGAGQPGRRSALAAKPPPPNSTGRDCLKIGASASAQKSGPPAGGTAWPNGPSKRHRRFKRFSRHRKGAAWMDGRAAWPGSPSKFRGSRAAGLMLAWASDRTPEANGRPWWQRPPRNTQNGEWHPSQSLQKQVAARAGYRPRRTQRAPRQLVPDRGWSRVREMRAAPNVKLDHATRKGGHPRPGVSPPCTAAPPRSREKLV